MIPAKELTKSFSSTRTYKFKISEARFSEYFALYQRTAMTYFNYGLQWLNKNWGWQALDKYFSIKSVNKRYMINDMKAYAQKACLERHGFDLSKTAKTKKYKLNIQAIDKMYDQLIINFNEARKKQRSIRYDGNSRAKYVRKHNRRIDCYGRIKYKHDPNEIKSITVKRNGNRINLINNYVIKIPVFGKVHVKQSMASLQKEKITEARIFKRANGDFVLQLVIEKHFQRKLTEDDLKNINAVDVNLKNNEFYAYAHTDSALPITWIPEIESKYQELDQESRRNQKFLMEKDHRHDNSYKTRKIKRRQARIKAKASFLIDEWQLAIVKNWVKHIPILAMEELNSFTMRITDKYSKKEKKKASNTNYKLAKVRPYQLRKTAEYIYQNNGKLLIEVLSDYTSQACSNCQYVNHDLKMGQKEWKCPNCRQMHDRDHNAALNILDWGLNPENHIVLNDPALKKLKFYKNLSEDDIRILV